MRVAPVGRLRQIVSGYQMLSVVALITVLVPFVAGQLRVAIYPQLEPQVSSYQSYGFEAEAPMALEGKQNEPLRARKAELDSMSQLAAGAMDSDDMIEEIATTGGRVKRDFSRYAPNAIVQAGPGIPSWRWNTYSLSWSGPVDTEQSMCPGGWSA